VCHFQLAAAAIGLMLAACSINLPHPNASRIGTVESIRQTTRPPGPPGMGPFVGGLAGLGLGSLVGDGTGRAAAQIVGALGGAYAGERIQNSYTVPAYDIAVRYPNGETQTIHQSTPPALQIGDKVRVTTIEDVRGTSSLNDLYRVENETPKLKVEKVH
jgi:outer membrane lipoprotein SlyB